MKRHQIQKSKAETLASLMGMLQSAIVPDLYYFSTDDYARNSEAILKRIQKQFGDKYLAIRSSAANEDGEHFSMAGAYHSELQVPAFNVVKLSLAIERVVAAYPDTSDHQVLVQEMVTDIAIAGVIMTRDLQSGAPYYVVNYSDDGDTANVTAGKNGSKTAFFWKEVTEQMVHNDHLWKVVCLARELETRYGQLPLDIEFAVTHTGQVFLLQLRQITVKHRWDMLPTLTFKRYLERTAATLIKQQAPTGKTAGSFTVYSQMADWNPAEIIGNKPNPLAIDLYKLIVTDRVWATARAMMGYKDMQHTPLMEMFLGRPYINVRNSFNSFLPVGLPKNIEDKLITAWLSRLAEHPEFHDKVEFDVAQTIYDFTFPTTFTARYASVLTPTEYAVYAEKLKDLTVRLVSLDQNGSLNEALQRIETLKTRQTQERDLHHTIQTAFSLLSDCQTLGTLPFSIIARHAFIAETILRSLVARNALSAERLQDFKAAMKTISGEFMDDFSRVFANSMSKEDFLHRYGHLRPSTYDIRSLRYDEREDLFDFPMTKSNAHIHHTFSLQPKEESSLHVLLSELGIALSASQFLQYAEKAIAGREYAKFVFSHHLSDAIFAISEWGREHKLSRDELSYVSLDDLRQGIPVERIRQRIQTRKRQLAREQQVPMGYILRNTDDLYCVPIDASKPNFVGRATIQGKPFLLDAMTHNTATLDGKIICIENADPGFDWIFTHPIAGLISKYGGANSHMTIRCSELGIPAAIGVGDTLFTQIVAAQDITLNCQSHAIEVMSLTETA